VTLSRYVLGVAGLTVVIGPAIFTAVVLRRRWLAGWSGAPARVAEAVLSVAILIGIAELLGVLGLFRPGLLALAIVAFGLATWRIGASEGSEVDRPAPPVPDGIATGIAALLTASVVSFWSASLARALKGGMSEPDTLAYHAPMAARFVQEHSTAHPFFATGEQVLTFVPANTELLHAIGILVMGSDVLSPLLNLGWLVLALAAAWAIGRPYGRGPATLAGAAVALATPQLVSLEPGAALNDVAVVALLLSIAALLVNGGRQPAPIVLAGLAAGLAAGTKATALVPVAVLTIAANALVRRGQRVKTGGLWLGAVLLGGGFWYIRNFVAFGTPVPSVRIGIGPVALPSIETRPAYTVAHYATDWHI
jgi:hypothetical protein